jgi:AcrR family transcriptional regulator
MARTRAEIAEAALVLFVEQGYDHTTLEQVADRADVHKRTLLRYFPTKAHLVLHHQYAALEEFRELMAQRGDASTLEVWTAHVVRHAREMMKRGRLADTRRIGRSEPTLAPTYLSIQAEYESLIAAGLEADLGGHANAEPLSRVAAAALVGGNYAVGALVFRREAYDELERATLEVIRLVRERLLPDISV